jgi:hypothetical protein
MYKTKRLALGLLFLAAPLATQANLLNFDFSFQNTTGDVSGTVSGEILGLANNSTGAASEVLITSFPVGLNSVLGAGPFDATTWTYQMDNSFTVVNGQVVAGGFWADSAPAFQLFIDGNPGYGINFLSLDATAANYVWGNPGLAAANIVPAPSVPDAAGTFSLLGAALAGLGVLRRKLIA